MSILAALAGSIGDAEPIATRGLSYILQRYPAARSALHGFLTGQGLDIPELVSAHPEELMEAGGRVDIACLAADGRRTVLIEGKFWAGLTGNQPNAYLATLADNPRSALAFVAPDNRFDILCAELTARLAEIGYPPVRGNRPLAKSQLPGKPALTLMSWRTLAAVIRGRFEAEANTEGCNDIDQITGLAELQDRKVVMPFTREELSDQRFARRQVDLANLADAIGAAVTQLPLASTNGLKKTPTKHGYGRYLRLGPETGTWLGYAADWWSEYGCTPIWLIFDASLFGRAQKVREILQDWEVAEPRRLFHKNGQTGVPITLPSGVEQQRIVDAAVLQIKEVQHRISGLFASPETVAQVMDIE